MADKLSVTLETPGAEKAIGSINEFRSAAVNADATINKLGSTTDKILNDKFSKSLSNIQRQAHDVSFQLSRISDATIGTKGLDGLGRAAQRSHADIQRTLNRLREIEKEMSVSRDPVVLNKLQAEAIEAGAALDRLQNKIDRVAAGRQAAQQKRTAADVQGRAGGLLGSAAAAGVPFASEASIGLDAAAAAGISAGALALAAGLAAAGVALVQISKNLRAEAERRLKAEEAIAIAANKELIARRDALKEFREADALRERDRINDERRANATVADRDALKQRIDLLKQLRDLDPTGPKAGEFDDRIRSAESRLNDLNKQSVANADAAFNARNEAFKKSQEQAREAERKRIQSINEGRQKIEQLAQTTDALFAEIFRRQGADNPFVAVFTDAEKAISDTRKATAGLSADLQKVALDLVSAQNANALFSARLESRIAAVNLRSDAANFRGANSTKVADDLAARALAKFKAELADGLIRNPANLAAFRSGTSNGTGLQLFNFQRQLEESGGLFRNPAFDEQTRRRLSEDPANQTVAERLDRQLAAIRSLRPENDAQRAEVDRRIIALTQGLRPEDLTEAQRNAAATARENEAARAENAEAAARKERADAMEIQKRIDKNIADLLKLAQKDGLTGVIRIINEAEDRANVELGKRPTIRDVATTAEP